MRCAALEGLGGFAHAFTTRRGPGEVPFDLSGSDRSAGPEGAERRRRLLQAIGLDGSTLVEARQVHGARVLDAATTAPGDEGDALVVTGDAAIVVGVRTADCVPVLLAHDGGAAGAAVHAGWRGIAAGVVGAAVGALARRGAVAGRLVAAIGPAIGGCCYEVGPDCARAIAAAAAVEPTDAAVFAGTDGRRIDLRAAVRRQLVLAGLRDEAVHVAPWCTRCRADLFFSHRGEGSRAGRMLAVLGASRPARRP